MNFGRIEFCVLFVCNRGEAAQAVSLNAGTSKEAARYLLMFACSEVLIV